MYDIVILSIVIVKKGVGLMKISTRGRYGTRMLLDIALHQGEKPALLKDIARRQEISLRYLEHLITPLIAGGIVRSTRGPRGGVSLTKSPDEIKLSDIVKLLEGSVAPAECVDNPEVCSRSSFCVTHDIWCEMKKAIDDILESTTLQDLVERQKKKEQPEPAMYFV